MSGLRATAFVAVLLGAAGLRFLATVGFPNDHYLYLAPAREVLHGAWPSRDFVDPGSPLVYIVSAVAQRLLGPPLYAEALVVAAAFGLAAALTGLAAARASRSTIVGIALAGAQVAMFPRSYHYPKLLVYSAGVLAIWAYMDRPSRTRGFLLAGCVVLACLFRYDHGVYLLAAALAAVALVAPSPRIGVVRACGLVALVGALLSPYVAYLQRTTGLVAHLAAGMAYSQAEASRTWVVLPTFHATPLLSVENAVAFLFYLFWLLPALALARAVWLVRQGQRDDVQDCRFMAPVALLGLVLNATMLRDPLVARLADASVPATVLAAWLWGRASSDRTRARWIKAAACPLVVAAAFAVAALGRPGEQLDRAGPFVGLAELPAAFAAKAVELRSPLPPRQFPSRYVQDLVSFFGYVDRCTDPADRLFVAGEAPEIYVFAQRGFAGGQHALRNGFFDSVADQQRLISRLWRERVPVALFLTDSDALGFTTVMRQLEIQFEQVGEIPIDGRGSAQVLASRFMMARGVDTETGWPCFR